MKKINLYFLLFMCIGFSACKKFLDAKPSSTLATLNSLNDVQSVLDFSQNVNQPQIGCLENSSDDFFVEQATYDSFSPYLQRQYTWQNSNVFGLPAIDGGNDWSVAYSHIYQANTVLEKIEPISISIEEISKKNDIKGQGYFLRGYSYLQMVLTWSKAYNQATAIADLGLPLRLSTDFNQSVKRSTVEQTYGQVISDLKAAAKLLPMRAATVHATRPGKAAAYAALARTYLSMRDYRNCLLYADSSLMVKSDLLDYNTLNVEGTDSSFERFAVPEVSYESYFFTEVGYFGLVDINLYNSYSENDLRKKLFFNADDQGIHYQGSYGGPGSFFCGLATDEVYLMRAECYARQGDILHAMADLNTLLKFRMEKKSFVALSAGSTQEAIRLVLEHRRKELIGRELRWMDLKRLNLDGANIILIRTVNGLTYKLLPNSARYAMPIPEDVLSLAGIDQNIY